MQGPPQDPTIPDTVMLQKFSGIKNTVTPERLGPDEFERALNIDLDDAGQPHRRRGFTLVSAGSFHSLHRTDDGTELVVKNGAIGVLGTDYTFYSLAAGIGPNPISYVQIGSHLFFSSVTDSGHIDVAMRTLVPWGQNNSAGVWLSPVVNPTSTLFPVRGKMLTKPPLATILSHLFNRIYLAAGPIVWATEPFMYNYVDRDKNYWQFESDVTNMGAVADGHYITTNSDVWFVGGEYDAPKRTRIFSYGGIPGTLVRVPANLVNPQIPLNQTAAVKVAVGFMTDRGFCVGMDSGECYNVTETKVLFPNARQGVGLFRQQDGVNQYLSVLDSEGGLQGSMRIGDYVSAEIVRGANTIQQ